jgi:hypothetical protein
MNEFRAKDTQEKSDHREGQCKKSMRKFYETEIISEMGHVRI